jgi:glyoxylase-like metal-dependent hydrolase (beta-lactamase superfamily II)
MDAVIPGLYASAPEPLPFGPALEIRAFVLERGEGNLLVSRAETLKTEVNAINELGGISRQYLTHRHEASPACDWIAETFGAPLHCHADDAPSIAQTCSVGQTFSERHQLDDDFEVIPIPGHTPGATAYLWNSGSHRCLFTGDTIVTRAGEWLAVVVDGKSDRGRYIESLELLRGFDFDVLAHSVGTSGQPHHAFVDADGGERRIERIVERLRRGKNH